MRYNAYRHARMSIVWAVLCVGVLAMSGCKDEVVPAEGQTLMRTLTIEAREFNTQTGAYDAPAAGARISVFEVKGGVDEVLLAELVADADGIARYAGRFPSAGLNVRVVGEFKNQRQYTSPPVFLFCENQTAALNFENVPVPDICCPPPDSDVLVEFFDEQYDTKLIQNTPLGVAEYYQTRTLFRNACSDTPITVEIPPVPAPFRIVRMESGTTVTGSRVTVQPGDRLVVQCAVSTKNTGDFEEEVDFGLVCSDGSRGRVRVTLKAQVIELPCDCGRDSLRVIVPESTPVPVGVVRTYNPINLFTVPLNCGPVSVETVTPAGPSRTWKLQLPNLPVTIQPGATFDIGAEFAPYRADSTTLDFTYAYRLADGTLCTKRARLEGRACHDMCPLLMDTVSQRQFSIATPHRVVLAENLGYVFLSPDATCNEPINEVDRTVNFLLPDTACCAGSMTFTISVDESPDPSRTSAQYFSASSSVTLTRGVRTPITISFKSPTISEFDRLFTSGRRPRTGTRIDSTFRIRLLLQGTTCRECRQYLDVTATVTPFMQLSPIRNLRAYGQRTDLVPVAPAEVSSVISYVNGNLSPGLVDNLLDINRRYPYPPDQFDFFVDVTDTARAFPPLPSKPPMLFRTGVTTFTKILRVRAGYPEQSFERIIPIVSDLQNDLLANGSYFLQPSLQWTFPGTPVTNLYPQPGDVYVIFQDDYWTSTRGARVPCRAALMYVRRVDNGQQNDTNHQSGVEFRLIYPIVLY